ncbi:MAG: TlpA family protein disulfide reductase [Myxococcales bacterium]|nr:TlpA family protein disulfide reductase [Myxococcales bacterium]
MRHRLPVLILLAAFAALAGCASRGLGAASVEAEPRGSPRWSATSVTALDGRPTELAEVLGGRVALISFWATWCDGCLREIASLERLQAGARRRGDAVVIGVAVGERHEVVAAFARSRGVAYPLFVDEDFHLADSLGALRVPATLVVDRAGRIVFRGAALDAAGLAAFRAALGDAGAEPASRLAPEHGALAR